jgi:hypothetical protein
MLKLRKSAATVFWPMPVFCGATRRQLLYRGCLPSFDRIYVPAYFPWHVNRFSEQHYGKNTERHNWFGVDG